MMGEWARQSGEASHSKPRRGPHQLALVACGIASLGLAGCGAGAAATAAHRYLPSIALRPCRLQDATNLLSVEAECGRLAVPENPKAPQGRRIRLFVARIPAISLRKRPDPLFILAGGPGQAASTFYPEVAPAFARIHRSRDIVLVDQRGTGRSNGLYCRFGDGSAPPSPKQLVPLARECLTALSRHADVALYTTTLAAGDLDRVRAALGYQRIDLYGVSYGTRLAQEYLRRFPGRVRSVVLDGPVPPEAALGARLPLSAQAALDRIFARCARERGCRERFGDAAAASRSLLASLAKHPETVTLANPTTGEPATVSFTAAHLETVLRFSTYTSEQAALLPLLIHEASARSDFAPLAAQYLLLSRMYGNAIADGMQYTVVCTEDEPLYERKRIARAQIDQTFLGARQIDALESVCSVWPRGPIDPRFHAPLDSDVPVLLLAGADDPVTPPAYAEEAARGLSHHLLIVLRGMGHGQLTTPCVGRLMAQFVERASTRIDTACTRRARAFPFFMSFAGPSP